MATTGLALFSPHAAAVPALGAGLVGGAGGGLLHQAAWARGGRRDVVVDAGTGIASSAVLAMATSPYRRVLVLLQTQHANPRLAGKFTPHASSKFSFTWLRCLSKLVRKQGFFSLWRGNCACLAGILPQTFATLCVHDRIVGGITSWLRPRQQDKPLSRAANLIASLGASCASASIVGAFTYPFALGYTRLAADVGSTHKAHPREFTGLFMGACSGGSSLHLWRSFLSHPNALLASFALHPNALHALLAGGTAGRQATCVVHAVSSRGEAVDVAARQPAAVWARGRAQCHQRGARGIPGTAYASAARGAVHDVAAALQSSERPGVWRVTSRERG
jgi:hypothetical protein